MERDTERFKTFSRRAFIIGTAKLGALSVLGGRLAYLQITEGEKYKTLSEKNRINLTLIAPSRGRIYDHKNNILADNKPNFRVNIIAEQAKDVQQTLKDLSKIIDLPDHEVNRILAEISKARSFVPVTVKEQLNWRDVSQIEVNLPRLPGLFIEEGEIRDYILGEATAHSIGYVGLVNQAELKTKDPVLTIPGFRVGKTGIEKKLDEQIRGQSGTIKKEVNSQGRIVRELEREYGKSGDDIILTLDKDFQTYTHKRLSRVKSASAVVMNAKTGAVYAMTSTPAFDPNLFSTRIPAETWEELLSNPTNPLTNKAIAGQYPPGSIFKMVTALAALEAKVIGERTTKFCQGHMDVGNHRFHCWKKEGHGQTNLVEALSQSCDVFFYEIARDVGIEKIAAMARKLGLGKKTELEMNNIRSGLVPDIDWKKNNFGETWRPGETILASIGQGYLQTTPLQLAVMTAQLINGGRAVSPTLLRDKALLQQDQELPDLSIPSYHLYLVKKGMDRAVNHPKGTAYAHHIPNERMAFGGKTGTAQVRRITKQERLAGTLQQDKPWKHRHHALFVGYAPVQNPHLVCSVVVEHGGSGSGAAAPIAKDLLFEAQARKLAS